MRLAAIPKAVLAAALLGAALGGCYKIDNDIPLPNGKFIIAFPLGTVTSESGVVTATFVVALGSVPTSEVTLSVSTTNALEGTPNATSVVFTPANWNTPQTVIITGTQDEVDDDDQPYTIVIGASSSADYHYNGIDPDDVLMTNTDDDTADVIVTPTSGLFTTEGDPAQAFFDVSLATVPTANVGVGLSVQVGGEGTLSTPLLTFTPADAKIPQRVFISSTDDLSADGPSTYTVITGDAASADPKYDGRVVDDVTVTNNDDESAGITVTPTSGLITGEAPGSPTATFQIRLTSQPSDTVTIDLSSLDTAEGTVFPAQLVFTTATGVAGGWDLFQTVTVTGVNDPSPVNDGDQPYDIQVGPVTSTDGDYSVIDPPDVQVTNIDDDVAGVRVTGSPLTTDESGATADFIIALDTIPTGTVTVTLTNEGPDTDEGSLSATTVTFIPGTDSDAVILGGKTVTVTGQDDSTVDGNKAYTLKGVTTSGDPRYTGLADFTVDVTNNDNDAPGIAVTPATTSGSPLITSESGTTSVFNVRLTSIPADTVTLTFTNQGPDTDEGSLSTTTVTFDPLSDTSTVILTDGKNVTITGIDDADIDGNVDYTLRGTPTSGDPAYNGLGFVTIHVRNADNENQPPGSGPWTKFNTTGVLSPGSAGSFDDKRVQEPSVILSGGAYTLWYEGSNGAGQKHEHVGRATSSNGTTWTKSPATPVLSHSGVTGSFEKTGVGDQVVLFAAGEFHTWFGGRENAAHKQYIGYASSNDGITWTKYAASAALPATSVLDRISGTWEHAGVSSPHVILDGATFKMWYHGIDASGIYRIGYATSTDKITWTKHVTNPVLDTGAAGELDDSGVMLPCVIKDGPTYRMWYVGRDDTGPQRTQRIFYAQSADGISWSKFPGNPILTPGGAGDFDERNLWAPFVIRDDTAGLFKMWYGGEDGSGFIRLGYAEAPTVP